MPAMLLALPSAMIFSYCLTILVFFSLNYTSATCNLILWARYLGKNPQYLSEQGLDFTEALYQAKTMFSKGLFFICSSNALNAIFVCYRTLTFFLSNKSIRIRVILHKILFSAPSQDMKWIDKGMALVCLEFGAVLVFNLYSTAITSQKLVDENFKLLRSIEANQIQQKQDDPNINQMIKELERFEGFDCNQYFTLNKSFLTSLLANFVTYFIVLVQFGIQ